MKQEEFENAEAILTRKEMHELTIEEQALLAAHFGNIEEAKSYRDFLMSMKHELSADHEELPEPDIFIAERVKSRMRELKREAEEERTLFQKIMLVMNHRVKLYQPALAMLAIIAVFIAVINNHDAKQARAAGDTLYADSSAVHNDISDSAMMRR